MPNPSKLYRAFNAVDKPLFEVKLGDKTYTDSSIRSIVITRGTSGFSSGLSVCTAEVDLVGYIPVHTNADYTISLSNAAAYDIAVRTNTVTSKIARRFTGRSGKQYVEQRPKNRFISTITGASWTSQLATVPDTVTVPSGSSIAWALGQALRAAAIRDRITIVNPQSSADTIHDPIERMSPTDLIQKYAEEVGIYLRNTRDGRVVIKNLWERVSEINTALEWVWPIGAHQAYAPAQWEQPNEELPSEFVLNYRTSDNKEHSLAPAAPLGTRSKSIEKDWRYIRFGTNQYEYIYGLRAQTYNYWYHITSIKIPVMKLWKRGSVYDRQIIRQLLELECGEVITIGGEWPTAVQGAYFADQITETITADEWTFEIRLSPYEYLNGQKSPQPKPRIWSQYAGSRWVDQQEKIWKDA